MTKHIDNFSTAGRLEIIFPFDIYRFLSAITLIVIHVKSQMNMEKF